LMIKGAPDETEKNAIKAIAAKMAESLK
jgi:hypothetical protein